MPQESQLAHRNVRTANVPYVSNLSATATDPCFIPGSKDILTSINGYAERRPGFATQLFSGTNSFQRFFLWSRTDGTFIEIVCDVTATAVAVYKFQIGFDTALVQIAGDSNPVPFDFVVSNNTLYMSNGHVSFAWTPDLGFSRNWGIAIGAVQTPFGPRLGGTGVNSGIGATWTNPQFAVSTTNFAQATVNVPLSFGQIGTAGDFCTAFGFTAPQIPPTDQINGITVAFGAFYTTTSILFPGTQVQIQAQLLKNGAPVATARATGIGTGLVFFTLGATSDLWGTTWTPNDVIQSSFGVSIRGIVIGSGTLGNLTFNVNSVQIVIFALGGPNVSLSGTGLTATTGYQYVFCYGNGATGHISSPSPPSNVVKPNNQGMQFQLTPSADPQVNQIRVFRSTDSVALGNIAQNYFEIPTSPFTNVVQTIFDNATDIQLLIANVAPTPTFNDPPPGIQGMAYYAGRIWGFAGTKVFFSGLEEVTLGVPEESFPSGNAGNFWAFDQPVTGLGVAGIGTNQVLIVFCGGRVYGITGTTVDTFRRFIISTRRGTRNLATVTALGGMVAWLDSSNQIWATDGNSSQELSTPIRPDLINVNPASCSMTFHVQGRFHWLVLSTGTLLYVYDMDTEQWMPPWSLATQYLFSGETAPGQLGLFACTPNTSGTTTILQMSTTAHNDNGSTYQPIARSANVAMVPDFGTRFSYIAAGIYDEPSRTGYPWQFQVDTNNVPLADVALLADDDPILSNNYTSIFSQLTTPAAAYNRNQGNNLVQNVYGVNQPYSRWISWQITGQNADDNLKIYGWFTSYKLAK